MPAPSPLRALAVLAGVLVLGSCNDATGPRGPGVPAQLQAISGNGQSATVGVELPAPLVVRVTDAKGKPVPDQIINFRVVAGGGSVFAGAATTNGDGEARERWTLGTAARDTQRVEARAVDAATGQPLVFATFTAVGRPDVPAAITGDGTVPTAGAGEMVAVSARVVDQYGNPVPAAPVVWNVQGGGGTISPAQGSTDSTGVAHAQWTLGLRLDSAQVATAWASPSLSAQFTAQAQVPVGTSLAVVSGNAQKVAAGDSLPQPLVARLQTAAGQPIQGATVAWTVSAGTLTLAQTVTDAQGEVRARWNPGTTMGVRTATVTRAGSAPVAFTAEVLPGAAAALRKLSGDAQTGEAGQPLAQPARVSVVDAYGNAVPGQVVGWKVAAGGGSVSPATSTTDSSGVASTGWTLGPTGGQPQRMEAEAGALTRVAFTATATSPAVQIIQEGAGQIVHDSLRILVRVVSPDPVIGVTATVAGRSFPLAPSDTLWRATVPVDWLPHGPFELAIEARRAGGAIGTVEATYIHDTPPVLVVEAPLNASVAHPTVRVRATCRDDGPTGCRLDVNTFVVNTGKGVATGVGEIDVEVNLAEYQGASDPVLLTFSATDSRGQLAVRQQRWVFVETSPRWTEVASASGEIVDADPGRLLTTDVPSPEVALKGSALKIVSRTTGAEQVVFQQVGRQVSPGFLTPRGAIFVDEQNYSERHLRDWSNGVLRTLVQSNLTGVQVAGAWASWIEGSRLVRRDLQSGAMVTVWNAAANNGNDVADNGDVVFSTGGASVFRYRAGAVQALNTPVDTLHVGGALTDGSNVVYSRTRNLLRETQVMLITPDGAEVALTDFSGPPGPGTLSRYTVNDGWVAYVKPGTGGVRQVWLRSPAGATSQVTSSTASESCIVTLGPGGQVVVRTGRRRFAARPGGALVDTAGSRGQLIWIGDTLHAMLGRSLFRIDY